MLAPVLLIDYVRKSIPWCLACSAATGNDTPHV